MAISDVLKQAQDEIKSQKRIQKEEQKIENEKRKREKESAKKQSEIIEKLGETIGGTLEKTKDEVSNTMLGMIFPLAKTVSDELNIGIGDVFKKVGGILDIEEIPKEEMVKQEISSNFLEMIAENTKETVNILKEQFQLEKLRLEDIEAGKPMDELFEEKGFFDKFKDKLMGFGPKIAQIAGGALFAGLTIDDFIKAGLPKFKEGDIFGGVIDTLLGATAITAEDVGRNILKQSAKWGGFGLMVGGPVGGAIGAGIGALAAGIKGALELEWDKQVGGTAERIQNLWADPSQGIGPKLLGTLVEGGKSLLGVISSGIRGVGDTFSDTGKRLDTLWKDQNKSMVEKIGGSIIEGTGFMLEAPINFFGSQWDTAMKLIDGFIPKEIKEFAKGIGDKIDETFGSKISETRRKIDTIWSDESKSFFAKAGNIILIGIEGIGAGLLSGMDKAREFLFDIGDKIRGFFDEIKEKGLGDIIKERIGPLIEAGKEFVEDSKEYITGFFDEIKEKGIRNSILERTGPLVEIGMNFVKGAQESITGFFTDVKEKGLGNTIKERVGPLIENARGFISNAGESFQGFMEDVREQGIIRTIFDRTPFLVENIGESINNMGSDIIDFFSNLEKDGLVKNIGLGLGYFIQKSGEIVNSMGESITRFFTDIKEKGLTSTIKDNISYMIDNAKGFINDMSTGISGFFDEIKEKGFGNIIKDTAGNIFEGIQDFFQDLSKPESEIEKKDLFRVETVEPDIQPVQQLNTEIANKLSSIESLENRMLQMQQEKEIREPVVTNNLTQISKVSTAPPVSRPNTTDFFAFGF